MFPQRDWNSLITDDRGSACCTRVKAKWIRRSLNETVEETIQDDDEVLVAIVHPKTRFPGRQPPKGVSPTTYFSRFIAFLPQGIIVARSGLFCLGYPMHGMDDANSNHSLQFEQMDPFRWVNDTYHCPRIHFVTGMVDAAASGETSSGSVIISYGISDCLSRFVEIKKSEIVRMLNPEE